MQHFIPVIESFSWELDFDHLKSDCFYSLLIKRHTTMQLS